MQGRWSIQDNHIALTVGNEMLHPSADELYAVLGKTEESFIDGIECEVIEDAFPSIRFSKIGSDIRCRLSNSGSDIKVELYCERKGKEVHVDVIQGLIVDQCITETEWFYVTGSTEEIEKLFLTAGIEECGKITISQYIEIIRNAGALLSGTLLNTVETSLLDKPIDCSLNVPKGINATLYKYQKT